MKFMILKKRLKLLLFCTTLLIISSTQSEINFEPDDWKTITTHQNIIRIDGTSGYIYFCSERGLLQYDYYSHEWANTFPWSELGFAHHPDEMWTKKDTIFFRYEEKYYYIIEFDLGWEKTSSIDGDTLNLTPPKCPKEFKSYFPPDDYFFNTDGVISDMNRRDYEITCCYKDPVNDFWMGTSGLGILKVPYPTSTINVVNYGLANYDVRGIAKSNQTYFFGGVSRRSQYDGLTVYEASESDWSYKKAISEQFLRSDNITCLSVINDSILLGGTLQGLFIYNFEDDDFFFRDEFDGLVDKEVYSVFSVGNTIWVGSENGISKGNVANLQFKKSTSSNFYAVYDFEYDGEHLWAATEDGPYFITPKGWRHFKSSSGFTDCYNWSLSLKDSMLWFATELGLLRFNTQSHNRKTYPSPTYLPETVYNDILATQRYVWIASNRGVIKYRKYDETWWFYKEKDGLASSKVWTIMKDGKYMLFGTDKGLSKFLWKDSARIDY